MIKPNAAKKLVQTWLEERGLPFTKLTAKTVNFVDLARTECVFVTVEGWRADPKNGEVENLAKANGFRVSFKGGF
jgi:hypothetical protein